MYSIIMGFKYLQYYIGISHIYRKVSCDVKLHRLLLYHYEFDYLLQRALKMSPKRTNK